MAQDMTRAEWHEFVMAGTRTAKLATVRADDRPHVAPIWFVVDGDAFVFTTAADTVKGTALRRDRRAALCVDDDAPPFAFVAMEGTVGLDTELDEMLRWATAIGGRYMGADRADEFGRRNAVEGAMLVRFTPTSVVARTRVSD